MGVTRWTPKSFGVSRAKQWHNLTLEELGAQWLKGNWIMLQSALICTGLGRIEKKNNIKTGSKGMISLVEEGWHHFSGPLHSQVQARVKRLRKVNQGAVLGAGLSWGGFGAHEG